MARSRAPADSGFPSRALWSKQRRPQHSTVRRASRSLESRLEQATAHGAMVRGDADNVNR